MYTPVHGVVSICTVCEHSVLLLLVLLGGGGVSAISVFNLC